MAKQEWILGQPVETDTTNYEWVLGQPYIITEKEEVSVGQPTMRRWANIPHMSYLGRRSA